MRDDGRVNGIAIADAGTTGTPGAGPRAGLEGVDRDLLADFVVESQDHLAEAETQLLELERDPDAAEPLNAVFRAFHSIKGVAGFVEMTHVRELAHRAESLLVSVREGEVALTGEAGDLVLAAVDGLRRQLGDIEAAMAGDGSLPQRPELASLLHRLGAVAGSAPAGAAGAGPVILNPATASAGAAKAAARASRETLRVDAARLDKLVEAIGELVIVESMVSKSVEGARGDSDALKRQVDNLDKISRELQSIGMSLRMTPVRPLFRKMRRLVRDLGRSSGREIDFTLSGEDTELDRAVVDRLADPLVHLLRNAADHGLEPTAEARLAAGKPERGRIDLRAFHKGGNIRIEVEDDGRGLDSGAILARALERGLVAPGQQLSDGEVQDLIFEPGFSTARAVTDISGRGVGMDVVRRNIESMRGTVAIDSEPGRGTVFSITLPLTLAIIEGLVVKVADERYIVPALAVERVVSPEAGQILTVAGVAEMLRYADELLPLLRLRRICGRPEAGPGTERGVVLVVAAGGRRFGLAADALLGQQQIVIKNLGDALSGASALGGGAILADGEVALILEMAELAREIDTRPGGAPVDP